MENNSPLNALSYMFKDNKFTPKYVVLFALTFLCMLQALIPESKEPSLNYLIMMGLAGLISIIVQILYYGYISAGIKAVAEQQTNLILPFFNLKTHAILGLKFLVASIFLGVAVCAVLIAGFIVSAVLAIISKPLGIAIFIILMSILFIFFIAFAPAFYRMFAVTQDIFAFFKFKEIFEPIRGNLIWYFKHIGLLLLLGLIIMTACIAAVLLKLSPILTGVLIAAAGAYLNMCFIYICAKCIK